jgi:hypothetical protein
MTGNIWSLLGDTAKRHMKAICGGEVTKSNVIGLRKAFNHVERLKRGWSGNRSAVTIEEADKLRAELERHQPRVVGELHESGLKLLRSPRYKKLWTPHQAAAIEGATFFRLIGFVLIDSTHYAPAYRVFTKAGPAFAFYHVPWQAALGGQAEAGPHVLL